ncbi:hypothetical protein HA466_0066750 [Hirschfeldia incana]|nr:hypothetical protein HA466_0066750 [Hirschfeldia incana]KAJ0260479.1 hypothetical protein HA466_0066750 [Hirschfeldia incana]
MCWDRFHSSFRPNHILLRFSHLHVFGLRFLRLHYLLQGKHLRKHHRLHHPWKHACIFSAPGTPQKRLRKSDPGNNLIPNTGNLKASSTWPDDDE